jgi:citronellol/citronellal dehydrogenase
MAANARGAFACIQAVLPHMIGARYGHILTFAPPLTARGVGGKIAYAAAKLATTVITLGAAEEGFAHNVAANTLWPATLIETPELAREGLGGPEAWRKPAILVDAAIAILSRAPGDYTGQSLIDEDVLRERGVTDFRRYRCAPDHEPPRVGFDYIRHG